MSERRDFFIYIKNEKKKIHQIFIYMKKRENYVFQVWRKLIYIKKKTSLNFRNVKKKCPISTRFCFVLINKLYINLKRKEKKN